MIATLHNHSSWSDGRASFAETHAFARNAKVDLLGLSDHFCIFPDGTSPDWSLQPSEVGAYLADVESYHGKGEIEVRVGLEFDWFEDHDKIVRPHVESIPLDYRIGAVRRLVNTCHDKWSVSLQVDVEWHFHFAVVESQPLVEPIGRNEAASLLH